MDRDYTRIADLSKTLGIQTGDVLLVGSDVFRLGYEAWVNKDRFDAGLFINLLQEALGGTGTLLFPAFTWSPLQGEPFDIRNSVPVTGTLSKAAVDREDFLRTRHPIHSFAVWGQHQETLCALNNASSFGRDSPFEFLTHIGAKMLMIDVDYQQCFTFVHYVEELENIWYRRKKSYPIFYIDKDGSAKWQEYVMNTRQVFIYTDVNGMGQILEEQGAAVRKYINGLPFVMIELAKAFDLIRDEIRNNGARNLYCTLPKKAWSIFRQKKAWSIFRQKISERFKQR